MEIHRLYGFPGTRLSGTRVLFWFIVITPSGTPVQQKCNFHSNKQQWRTQQLASTPTVCTDTRASEATTTRRRHGPAEKQQQE
jgi:hypothetical protein